MQGLYIKKMKYGVQQKYVGSVYKENEIWGLTKICRVH